MTAPSAVSPPDALSALAPAWDATAGTEALPMQRYAWIRACADTPVAGGRAHVLYVGDVHAPDAIGPLVVRPSPWGGRRLELLGMRALGEPTDLVGGGENGALGHLAETVAQLRIPLTLHRIRAESGAVRAIQGAFRGRGVVRLRPDIGWPGITLEAGSPEPEARLNGGRRSDLRRARRLAERTGPVTCSIESPAEGEHLDRLLDEAMRVEAAGWKSHAGSALLKDQALASFYRRYAAAASREGALRLCFLRIGGKTAAMQFAVELGERFWLLKIGYDEAFARCSPGTLLILETLRYAAARGLKSYEFLGTPQPWIGMWTKEIRPCVSVRAYPARGGGMVALAADLVHSGWLRLAKLRTRGA